MKSSSVEWINQNQDFLKEISNEIWSFAETGYKETKSADLMRRTLEKAGFTISNEIAGIPTAFRAEWGKGNPKIGFLAEYDALENLGQNTIPRKEVPQDNTAGHGCGHNLLGAGVLGGVLGLKEEMEKEDLKGTLVFYGCPAEELLTGKVYMAREGAFDDLDLALTWHGMAFNVVSIAGMQALDSVKFNFSGVTAHAAFDPANGRSAQDAVELMNVGANYLREHIPSDCRIHYAITQTGKEPNVVPAFAQVWYYVRADNRSAVKAVYKRLEKVAQGAALMTGTSVEVEKIGGCYDLNCNQVIANVYLESLKEVGAPAYSVEENTFAYKLADTFPEGAKATAVAMFDLPKDTTDYVLHNGVGQDLQGNKSITQKGSTDVGDVSWIVPTAWFFTATAPIGTPGHSWQITASSGMSIGHKGMLTAAKILALTGIKFLRSPQLVKACKKEFLIDTDNFEYKSPIPEGVYFNKN